MDVHPDLVALASWVGTWRGEGHGEYPTIQPFDYGEELTVAATPKPFLHVTHRTWSLEDGSPLHTETGYWRLTPSGLEAVIAHPFGATELLLGTVSAEDARTTLELRSGSVATTPTAKPIEATRRTITIDGDRLDYRMAMAAVGLPLTHHLAATLHRQQSG